MRGSIAAGLDGPPAAPTQPAPTQPAPAGARASVFTPLSALPVGEQAVCELRTLTDGRLGLLVYPSVAELVACCGTAQPWAEVPSARVEELRQAAGADVVLTGAALPPASRRDLPHREAPTSTDGSP